MNALKNILSLLQPGISSILPKRYRKNGLIFILIITSLLSFIFIKYEIKLSSAVSNFVLPALSIFTALVFSAIFTVPSQLSQKVSEFEKEDDEPTVNFLITYRNFIQTFSRQLVSLVLISLVIIIILILNEFCNIVFICNIICALFVTFSLCFLALFVLVIRNISRMVEEHISFSTNKIKEKQRRIE